MQAGACSMAPRNSRRPLRANDSNARFTPPWSTARAVSQPGSASSRSRAGRTRSNSPSIVSPPRNRVGPGSTPRNAPRKAASSSSGASSASRPGTSSRSSGHSSIRAAAATRRAVSTVRGRPLVRTRSNRAPARAAPARRAWPRPVAVSGTSSGATGWPCSSK